MSLKLIKCLLNKEFYDKYKHKLTLELFPQNDTSVKGIYHTLIKAFDTVESNLTVDSLRELHYTYNPALSTAHKNVLDGLFAELNRMDLTQETGEIVLKKAIEQQLWTELCNLSIQGADGHITDFLKAQEILDNIREGISLNKDIKVVTGSIKEMLEATSQMQKWKFHIPTLRRSLDGIGPSTFTLLAARPNVGKTALIASFIAQEGGFLDQGAHVTYIGNEEAASRTRLRMASAYTGFPREALLDEKIGPLAQEQWDKISHKLTVLDMAGYSIEELQKYIKDAREPIDILIIDQLDKLSINGSYSNEADRLRKLYTTARELLKRYDIAGIGVCQASVAAENRAVFGMDCLENSKTGKGAEVDVCMCLGRHLEGDARDIGARTLNLAKNKLSGKEDYVSFFMEFNTSRVKA